MKTSMKTTRFLQLLLPVIVGGLALATNVFAQSQPEQIGEFKDWTAYKTGEGQDQFCYIVSKPKDASLRDRRGEIFYLIWHRPGTKEWDVVQVDIGYNFKPETDVEVTIGGQTWSLFTREGNAWAYETADDSAIVKAMRAGSKMAVKGTSSRNNPTTDSYSLSGVTKAHNAINQACGR